ncbi:hypothetical protein [Streptomyces sp. MJP52]|uniref:hypothetical protein n=1 Tax=Streptomyces sp. MJP52 TaxID=2940555 RepID=UPI002474A250|nr:hypothetical protein [Streptomyces sp. MJP52]MDH6226209.1 hypothetical protein [Streptomyces sp. MJP52]
MAVRMRHEGVEGEIEVAEISVRQYERSGWEVVDDRPAVDVTTTEMTTEVAPRRKTPREN